MQYTQKTPRRCPPPRFLTGTTGTTGTALSGAGFSRPGSGTTPGQTGTRKPRRALAGNGWLTRPPALPLFSVAKVAPRLPLPGEFSEYQRGQGDSNDSYFSKAARLCVKKTTVDNSVHNYAALFIALCTNNRLQTRLSTQRIRRAFRRFC